MDIRAIFAAVVLGIAGAVSADPAAPPAYEKIPVAYTDKVAATPHFYQRDPRWNLDIAGETYCVPASVSDSLVYFAANGFGALLPIDPQDLSTENLNREFAQAELVERLASPGYMNTKTAAGQGTTPSEALFGVRRYVEQSGYVCKRLEYEGWRRLRSNLRQEQLASKPDLDWIKSAIADPNGAAWLEIGFYTRGDTPGVWKRQSGHTVAAVGYGTDGGHLDPNIFLVDNPAMGRMTAAAQSSGRFRPITIADLVLMVAPAGDIQITSEQMTSPHSASGLYQIGGPGVPYSHKKFDAAFLDGAIVLIIGQKP
jgi:hypothetical protein